MVGWLGLRRHVEASMCHNLVMTAKGSTDKMRVEPAGWESQSSDVRSVASNSSDCFRVSLRPRSAAGETRTGSGNACLDGRRFARDMQRKEHTDSGNLGNTNQCADKEKTSTLTKK
ncbi:hypothetical protein BDR06DRAFT_976959 [Suillus hirtellus]|nr:hypothetical protein BDR06DRAFT_976959 [Suillus hirtellus]